MTASDQLGDLTRAVQELTEQTVQLNKLPEQVSELTVSDDQLRRHSTRNRILIMFTILGLCADVVFSLLIWRITQQQNCQNALRARQSAIADQDRRNVDAFFGAIVHLKNSKQFPAVYQHYLAVRNADNAERAKLGAINSTSCSLF